MAKQITKISVIVNVEGQDEPLFASLAFQGFNPNQDDVLRLYGVLKDKVDEPVNVINAAALKEKDGK